jgi:hypothetical protein
MAQRLLKCPAAYKVVLDHQMYSARVTTLGESGTPLDRNRGDSDSDGVKDKGLRWSVRTMFNIVANGTPVHALYLQVFVGSVMQATIFN